MNKSGFISPVGRSAGCLSNPAHPVTEKDVLCPLCGSLVQDTMIGPYQVKRLLRSYPSVHQKYAASQLAGGIRRAEYTRHSQFYLAMRSDPYQPVLLKILPPDPAGQQLWKHAWQDIQRIPTLRQSSILPVLDSRLWYPASSTCIAFHSNFFTATNRHSAFFIVVYQYAPHVFAEAESMHSSGSSPTRRLTVKQLLRFIEQAVSALTFVHNLGFVHGDLEPDNIFFDAQFNQLWIAGFGLGRLQPPPPPFLAPELLSTVHFCEQYQNITAYREAVTEASDQYALAVLCYHLFSRTISPALLQRILPVLHRASQANPALRFQHLGDFARALAAEFGVGQLFLPESTAAVHQTGPGEKNISSTLSTSSPAADPSAETRTRAQKANQLEQVAGQYFTARDYQAAVRAYTQLAQLDTTRASAWSGLGDTYFALERYPEALEAYTRALSLDPRNADTWFNRATVFDLLGRAQQAAHDYAQAEHLRAEA